MTHRLAIFDCDGTLVDSQANICMAMEHAFEGAGLTPPRRHGIRRVVGLSLVESMRVLLPDAEDKCHQDMAEHYRTAFLNLRNNGLVDEPLYDGMASLLSEMDAGGWLLGVATGKNKRRRERQRGQQGKGVRGNGGEPWRHLPTRPGRMRLPTAGSGRRASTHHHRPEFQLEAEAGDRRHT